MCLWYKIKSKEINMSELVETVLSRVTSRKQAEELVTELLVEFSGETAWNKIASEAYASKQKPTEVTRRAVSNLFRTFNTRK